MVVDVGSGASRGENRAGVDDGASSRMSGDGWDADFESDEEEDDNARGRQAMSLPRREY